MPAPASEPRLRLRLTHRLESVPGLAEELGASLRVHARNGPLLGREGPRQEKKCPQDHHCAAQQGKPPDPRPCLERRGVIPRGSWQRERHQRRHAHTPLPVQSTRREQEASVPSGVQRPPTRGHLAKRKIHPRVRLQRARSMSAPGTVWGACEERGSSHRFKSRPWGPKFQKGSAPAERR
ncbi:hypothetical protein DB31_7637 [Hyalangium minutum]|uniref:Uncharacterized protein n=1 Tax=Hyalangium minutum TaxID=394096 RepID=A0A085WL37_9BACT|nr:hypothetical protein DB31_7637 [Hyalangium minutum]